MALNDVLSAMVNFLSGPPGGRTLPHTTAKLSDLAGGVYGPGASVASTGMNAHRTVIKASTARAAGETWEDVLEYYLVRLVSRDIHRTVNMTSDSIFVGCIVQCRQRSNGLRIPTRQDLLPGQHLLLRWGDRLRGRRCRRHPTRLRPRSHVLPPHRPRPLASRQPLLAALPNEQKYQR